MKRIRRYLVAGILVWLPLGVTLLLINFLVGVMDRTLGLVPMAYRPETLLGFAIPGLGVILTIIILLVTGVLVANIVGRSVVGGWESLLERIPIVRSIYSAAKNFTEIVFSDSGKAFKKVLLVQYPRKGIYTLTFQTATEMGEVQGAPATMLSAVLCRPRRTRPPASSSLFRRPTRSNLICRSMRQRNSSCHSVSSSRNGTKNKPKSCR